MTWPDSQHLSPCAQSYQQHEHRLGELKSVAVRKQVAAASKWGVSGRVNDNNGPAATSSRQDGEDSSQSCAQSACCLRRHLDASQVQHSLQISNKKE